MQLVGIQQGRAVYPRIAVTCVTHTKPHWEGGRRYTTESISVQDIMKWIRIFFIVALFASGKNGVESRLMCQRAKGGRGVKGKVGTKPRFVRPNLCCGPKPFNSGFSTCCMGRTVDRSIRKCCLSGNPVVLGASCSCNPNSKWIIHQSEILYTIEMTFRDLTKSLQELSQKLTSTINEREEIVQELDARANTLYQSFLAKINIVRNQDPEEVQYIYNLVTFLQEEEGYNGLRHEEIEEPNIEILSRKLPILQDQEEGNLESPDEVENLILERNEIMETISKENDNIFQMRERIQVVENIRQMLLIDTELILQLRELLDIILRDTLVREDLEREEDEVVKETEVGDGGSFDVMKLPTSEPPPESSELNSHNINDIPEFEFGEDYEVIKDYTYYIIEKDEEQNSRDSKSVTSTPTTNSDFSFLGSLNDVDSGCDVSRWNAYVSNFSERAQIASSEIEAKVTNATKQREFAPTTSTSHRSLNGGYKLPQKLEKLSFPRISEIYSNFFNRDL